MKNPLVSIVIPVYNGGHFLKTALESVLAQDYQPYEIIIVDDGSTDNTAEIASSVPEARYYYQANQGVAAARNRGVLAARGDYLAFLDADDIWAPGKLSLQVSLLRSHPEVGYCFTYQKTFLEPEIAQMPSWVREDMIEKEQPGYVPSSLVVRRKVFDQVGFFDPGYETGEDSDWFFRARDSGIALSIIPETLLYKRIHSSNLSSQVKKSHSNLLRAVKASLSRKNNPVK